MNTTLNMELLTQNIAELAIALKQQHNIKPTEVMNKWFEITQEHPISSIAEFEVTSDLQSGAFGKVKLAKRHETLYALKIVDINATHAHNEKMINQLIKNQSFLTSPLYLFETCKHLYIVMKFYSSGDLFEKKVVDNLYSLERSVFYISQLILALEALHSLGIIYRDLKLENVMVEDDGYLTLVDFGGSIRTNKRGKARGYFGTIPYIAPEVSSETEYTRAVDFWSAGILFSELLLDEGIFEKNAGSPTSLIKKVRRTTRNQPNAVDFVSRLLATNPKERLGYRGAKQVKKHDLFKDIDWNMLINHVYKVPE